MFLKRAAPQNHHSAIAVEPSQKRSWNSLILVKIETLDVKINKTRIFPTNIFQTQVKDIYSA